jgi:methionine synthase I (cobalamin-dependent)
MSDLWMEGGPWLTDGAWGTELQKRGLGIGEVPDFWNLERPDDVLAVARSYVDAGSRVILTNTFRANAIALGSADRIESLNRAGVEISRQAACAAGALVFASIGPSGKVLMSGDVSAEELDQAFRAQASALCAGGADALLVETMSDIGEARLAVRAARATGLPVIASFVFDTGKNKDRTMMGHTPENVAEAMIEEGVQGIGANCGLGACHFAPIARRLRQASGLPVWIKPNAGMPVLDDGHVRYQTTPEEFAANLDALLEAGASFVGGCCGTNPDFIRALGARFHK